jgi:hypothetical protein
MLLFQTALAAGTKNIKEEFHSQQPAQQQMFTAAESLAKFIPDIGKRSEYRDAIANIRTNMDPVTNVKELIVKFSVDILAGIKKEEQQSLLNNLNTLDFSYKQIENWDAIINNETKEGTFRDRETGRSITVDLGREKEVEKLRAFIGNDDIFDQFMQWARTEIAKYAAKVKGTKSKKQTVNTGQGMQEDEALKKNKETYAKISKTKEKKTKTQMDEQFEKEKITNDFFQSKTKNSDFFT